MTHADDADLVEVIAIVLRDRYPSPPGESTVGHRGDARAIVAAFKANLDVVDRWLNSGDLEDPHQRRTSHE